MSSYYVIVPSKVRYDKQLRPNEKLLYGEILALSHKEGYCYATNKYLADLYDVTEISISNWIGNLVAAGYIKVDYDRVGAFVNQRRIYVTDKSIIDSHDSPVDEVDNAYEKAREADRIVKEVVDCLNKTCGTRFKSNTSGTAKLIKARLREGFSLQDFEKVIKWKQHEWGDRPFKFTGGQLSSNYLRPSTLFGNKFETYLYEADNNTNSETTAVRSVPVDDDRSGVIFV